MEHAYLGVDVGSISTKGVILDRENRILASQYIWTQGDPIGAVKRLTGLLEEQFDKSAYEIVATGTTGSARKLVGVILGATMVKNEITAHAAGTGAFLSSQAKRLGIEVEEIGDYALRSTHPTQIAARCTVFAESDLVHKIQMGHPREDIIAGVCNAVAANYLNNVGKGKKIVSPVVFQGGVSKNKGVVAAFERTLNCPVLVDPNGHLMGAIGAAILARKGSGRKPFDFSVENMEFRTREAGCGRCPNQCEIICVYRGEELIDAWGNRCERGAVAR